MLVVKALRCRLHAFPSILSFIEIACIVSQAREESKARESHYEANDKELEFRFRRGL
jgi:hypothetical protein